MNISSIHEECLWHVPCYIYYILLVIFAYPVATPRTNARKFPYILFVRDWDIPDPEGSKSTPL